MLFELESLKIFTAHVQKNNRDTMKLHNDPAMK